MNDPSKFEGQFHMRRTVLTANVMTEEIITAANLKENFCEPEEFSAEDDPRKTPLEFYVRSQPFSLSAGHTEMIPLLKNMLEVSQQNEHFDPDLFRRLLDYVVSNGSVLPDFATFEQTKDFLLILDYFCVNVEGFAEKVWKSHTTLTAKPREFYTCTHSACGPTTWMVSLNGPSVEYISVTCGGDDFVPVDYKKESGNCFIDSFPKKGFVYFRSSDGKSRLVRFPKPTTFINLNIVLQTEATLNNPLSVVTYPYGFHKDFIDVHTTFKHSEAIFDDETLLQRWFLGDRASKWDSAEFCLK